MVTMCASLLLGATACSGGGPNTEEDLATQLSERCPSVVAALGSIDPDTAEIEEVFDAVDSAFDPFQESEFFDFVWDEEWTDSARPLGQRAYAALDDVGSGALGLRNLASGVGDSEERFIGYVAALAAIEEVVVLAEDLGVTECAELGTARPLLMLAADAFAPQWNAFELSGDLVVDVEAVCERAAGQVGAAGPDTIDVIIAAASMDDVFAQIHIELSRIEPDSEHRGTFDRFRESVGEMANAGRILEVDPGYDFAAELDEFAAASSALGVRC